jgi:signal transduction histidine kinase
MRALSISALFVGLFGLLSWFLLIKNFIPLLKDRIFRYIFIGYTAIFLTFLYQLLILNGTLQMNSFSVYSFSLGSIFEMYFFALGITQYLKEIEKDKVNKDKLLDFQMRFASIGRVVGNISHQWKVPLVRASALLTHIEAILHFRQESYYSKIEELVPEIRSYFVFMQNSIDEFYSLYSQNTHKIDFKLLPIINDVWGMLSSKIHTLNAKLYVKDKCDATLFSYEYSFAHILIILIDNALDMAKLRNIKEPQINITINSSIECVNIIIEDNCGGITQEPIESIFEIDVSSKDHSLVNGGLGLAIVKTLVNEKFNGSIVVRNAEHGAYFHLTLPNDKQKVLSEVHV